VLRGAVPVFVDIRSDTLNVDEAEVEAALTDRTKAVFCVHYAGVACAMDRLQSFCTARGLALVEDAAQAVHATWRGRRLGGIGDFGVFSFHASKNVTAGEGGALLVNRPAAAARAEMVWEKGTDRARFSRNDVEFYRWQTIGSSFLPSEIIAALLATQLAAAAETTRRRLAAWRYYDARLRHLPGADALVFPDIPQEAGHNGHIYHLRTSNRPDRDRLRRLLRLAGIETATHYEPLHTSPAGLRYGRSAGRLDVTLQAATTLLRLPLDGVITTAEQDLVIEAVAQALPQLG
jgi:dTDP-4-amino-4,6-dideoxygalactose transaminase